MIAIDPPVGFLNLALASKGPSTHDPRDGLHGKAAKPRITLKERKIHFAPARCYPFPCHPWLHCFSVQSVLKTCWLAEPGAPAPPLTPKRCLPDRRSRTSLTGSRWQQGVSA